METAGYYVLPLETESISYLSRLDWDERFFKSWDRHMSVTAHGKTAQASPRIGKQVGLYKPARGPFLDAERIARPPSHPSRLHPARGGRSMSSAEPINAAASSCRGGLARHARHAQGVLRSVPALRSLAGCGRAGLDNLRLRLGRQRPTVSLAWLPLREAARRTVRLWWASARCSEGPAHPAGRRRNAGESPRLEPAGRPAAAAWQWRRRSAGSDAARSRPVAATLGGGTVRRSRRGPRGRQAADSVRLRGGLSAGCR